MSDPEDDQSAGLISWDEQKRKSIAAAPPNAKYGATSESLRHSIPEARVCAMFCKGKNCKYESATQWKPEQMDIQGMYSNWITKNILAMARPNTTNIEKYHVMEQFKKHGIASIINLQLPGEHCTCGPPLEAEGFSYKPQDFMDNDIFFYNFGWQDYGVGSLANILDMVKVMQFAVSEGKVAIHCHAGLGRTGVLIACYLVYAHRMEPGEVVHYIRSRRPPSVQTRSQIICIQEFAQYLQPLRVVFSSIERGAYDFNLTQFLTRQKHMLHGFEARKLKFIPKVIYECCERLLRLAGHGHKDRHHQDSLKDILRTAPNALNNAGPLTRSMSIMKSSQATPGPEGQSSILNPLRAKSLSLESFTAIGTLRPTNSSLSMSPRNSDSDSAHSSVTDDKDSRNRRRNKSSNRYTSSENLAEKFTGEQIARAMAGVDRDPNLQPIIDDIKLELNVGETGWRAVQLCKDPVVLAGLMWDWIDNLKEPILHAQDLPNMLEYTGSPLEGLALLHKGTQCTVELIFKTIACLEPLTDDTERSVVQRVLSVLTHQNMVVEADPFLSQEKSFLRRTSNDTGLMRGGVANKMMYFFMHLLYILHEEKKLTDKELSRRRKEEALNGHKEAKKSPLKQNRDLKDRERLNVGSMRRRKSLEAEDKDLYSASQPLALDRRKLNRHVEEDESEEEEDDSEEEESSSPQSKSSGSRTVLGKKSLPPLRALKMGTEH